MQITDISCFCGSNVDNNNHRNQCSALDHSRYDRLTAVSLGSPGCCYGESLGLNGPTDGPQFPNDAEGDVPQVDEVQRTCDSEQDRVDGGIL